MNEEKVLNNIVDYEAKYLSPEFKKTGYLYELHCISPTQKELLDMIESAYNWVNENTPFDSDEVVLNWSQHTGESGTFYKDLCVRLSDITLLNLEDMWNDCTRSLFYPIKPGSFELDAI